MIPDLQVARTSDAPCGHPSDYRTLYRSPVFGLVWLCTHCGELESTERDHPCAFTDRYGFCTCPHSECDDHREHRLAFYGGRHAGARSIHGARRRLGRHRRPSGWAARRITEALDRALAGPGGIHRW